MLTDSVAFIIFWLLVIYSLGGTIYHIIGSYHNAVRRYKEAEARNKETEASLAAAEDYAGDLESGYAMMATNIESMQGELGDIHRWMDSQDQRMQEHCVRLDQIAAFRIVIHPVQPYQNLDYTGSDGYEEEPYSESDCPTLPEPVTEWVVGEELKGLDTL